MVNINLFNHSYNGIELASHDGLTLDYYIKEIDLYIRNIGKYKLNKNHIEDSIWFAFKNFGNLEEVDFQHLPKEYTIYKESYSEDNILTFILLDINELDYLIKQII